MPPLAAANRAAIAALAVLAACGGNAARTAPAPSSSPQQLTTAEQVHHVLDRLSFGARPGDAQAVAAMGVDRWIDQQLSPETISDSAAESRLQLFETQRKRAFELLADHPDPQEVQQRLPNDTLVRRAQQAANQLSSQVQNAPVLRAVTTERQLQEVMTVFWENHFSVYGPKSPNRYAMLEFDRDVIRPRALGKFRDLLGAVAKSPMMLFYLDNAQSGVDSLHSNVDEAPIDMRRLQSGDSVVRALGMAPRKRPRGLNENYARELLELHTLGVDGGYTQRDVQEVARALTGWTIAAPQLGGGFIFRPELHDANEKIVLGHRLPGGRGVEDGDAVLDIVARHPSTARYVVTKLARHFVSDDPPASLIDRCAAVFGKTDGDIRETMRCVVKSPEFFSRATYRAKVKTPFELVVSSLRAMQVSADTAARWAPIVANLGQPMYGHLTPEGWPDRGDAWMNSGAILNRINFAQQVASDRVYGVKLAKWPIYASLVRAPRATQVDGVIAALLGGHVSDETRRTLIGNDGGSLGTIVALALGSPEFQRR